MGKGPGNMGGFLKQAQQMQKKMAETQENLKNRVVEGTAGGGMVSAMVNGHQEVLKLKIEQQVVDPDDVEMLQDLIMAAVNEALEQVRTTQMQQMAGVAGGLNIPGLTG